MTAAPQNASYVAAISHPCSAISSKSTSCYPRDVLLRSPVASSHRSVKFIKGSTSRGMPASMKASLLLITRKRPHAHRQTAFTCSPPLAPKK
eukprot:2075301-Amphidinium_carterae.1